jgi:ATP-dependent RNA helicase DOB1
VLQETARRIAQVSTECKLTLVADEYVAKFKVELMEVVYRWCKGASFADILKVSLMYPRKTLLPPSSLIDTPSIPPQLTDAFEGSLIRAFRRLQELIRQMGQAAKAIGNTELEEKFAKSLEMLERPNTVVFNPSYVRLLFGPFLTPHLTRLLNRLYL